MNSRRRLAPPLGTRGDSGLVQSSGVLEHSPTVQRAGKGQPGAGGEKRGKKRHWELRKARTCQSPSSVLRPNLHNVQNQPKISVWYLWKGLPSAGKHLPRAGIPQVKAKPPQPGPQQLVLLFFSVFSTFWPFFPSFWRCRGLSSGAQGL